MADLAHLERMGRELKCPICLSLLRSTATLPCCHMFCGSCISESTRTNSSCPVCKVPVHRREIRPAAHMDNLVSIYRNMEAAAGVTIFASQAAPPQAKTEDLAHKDKEKGSAASRSRKKQISKEPKKDKQNTRFNSCNIPKKSSISSNKRVHVTPYSASETPIQHNKLRKLEPQPVDSDLEREADVIGTQNLRMGEKSISNREVLRMDSNGDPILSPFFCLGEFDDDAETQGNSISQQTLGTQSLMPQLPCFSDIKDSDEEYNNVRMTPSSKNTTNQVLDSEMFEWTQRPCSPELCSSPIKKHAARSNYPKKYEVGETVAKEKKTNKKVKLHATRVKKSKQPNSKSAMPVPGSKNDNSISLCPEPVKSKTPMNLVAVTQNIKSSAGASIFSKTTTEDSVKGRKQKKRKQLDHPELTEAVTADITNITQNQSRKSEEGQVVQSSCSRVKPSGIGTSVHLKCRRSTVNYTFSTEQKHSSGTGKENTDACNATWEIEHGCNVSNRKTRKSVGWAEGVKNEKEAEKESRNQKEKTNRLNTCTSIADNDSLGIDKGEGKDSDPGISGFNNAEGDAALQGLSSSGNMPDIANVAGNQILRKCSSDISQINCAFCHSSAVTEVSGELMHYFNGKPVAKEFNGGIGLIHSHKQCTEWAPNVYFENETAINLASELARSKRIKCSCCNAKGASLGCYERTCRKSFHFTCAKMMHQCRWDTENFVMLCPLHVASKLPCEASELQKQKKRRLISKEGAGATKEDGKFIWKWPQGSYKWLFCCSALSPSEKEIVSKFAKLAGISVSKVWASNVTHVITSCDETGACRRTLKVLMGILEGRWIVNIDWLKACTSAGTPVSEEPFEITVDNHGIRNGPQLGRLRITNEKAKLFSGFRFYFMGDFSVSYKGYLQDLVIAAGGSVLQRKPIATELLLHDNSQMDTYIIYGRELTDKQSAVNLEETMGRQRAEAKLLAEASGAKVASNSWILDSIAACSLTSLV